MDIQGQTVNFKLSSYYVLFEENIGAILQLSHFINKGLIPKELREVDIENFVLMEFTQMKEEAQLKLVLKRYSDNYIF